MAAGIGRSGPYDSPCDLSRDRPTEANENMRVARGTLSAITVGSSNLCSGPKFRITISVTSSTWNTVGRLRGIAPHFQPVLLSVEFSPVFSAPVENRVREPGAVLLKYGRPVAKCDPWIQRETQGPTMDGPFGDQWILYVLQKKYFGRKVDRQLRRCTDIISMV